MGWVAHSPAARVPIPPLPMSWSVTVMVLSVERYTSKAVIACTVPWLQTVTTTVLGAPGATETGPLTWVTTRSGRKPIPIRFPARALLVSISSGVLLKASTMAPANQFASGEEKPSIARSLHSPGIRNGTGAPPAKMSCVVMVASEDSSRSTHELLPVVPWLQTRTVACQEEPGMTLGCAVTWDTTKSGPEPTARTPPLPVLLVSMSSVCPLNASAMAPTNHGPLETEAFPRTGPVSHCPGIRGGVARPPTKVSAVVKVSSEDSATSTQVEPARVPWLHTVTIVWNWFPLSTLGGPDTALTTKSGALPTPSCPPTPALLSSKNSGTASGRSATAPRK